MEKFSPLHPKYSIISICHFSGHLAIKAEPLIMHPFSSFNYHIKTIKEIGKQPKFQDMYWAERPKSVSKPQTKEASPFWCTQPMYHTYAGLYKWHLEGMEQCQMGKRSQSRHGKIKMIMQHFKNQGPTPTIADALKVTIMQSKQYQIPEYICNIRNAS